MGLESLEFTRDNGKSVKSGIGDHSLVVSYLTFGVNPIPPEETLSQPVLKPLF